MGSYAHVCATPEHHARAVGPGRSLQAMYATYMRESAQGDYTGLPALHAAAAGLKAHCSAMAADGIERARLLCGGHGYLASAGFATLFTNYVPQRCGALPLACVDGWPRWWGLTGGGLDEGGTAGSTYEGENTVMYLQAGRYLVKAYQAAADGQPLAKEVDYLKTPAATATRWAVPPPGADLDVPVLLAALRHRARVVVAVAGRAVAVAVAAGTAFPDAVNVHGVAVVDAAKAHWYAPPPPSLRRKLHTQTPRASPCPARLCAATFCWRGSWPTRWSRAALRCRLQWPPRWAGSPVCSLSLFLRPARRRCWRTASGGSSTRPACAARRVPCSPPCGTTPHASRTAPRAG
jgi:hypothetical protein